MTTFSELNLSPETLAVVAELGFEAPTPVQAETIPALLEGRDVIAQAPTGTGKTAAYGLPMVERLDDTRLEPQALVMVPTRELAIQVSEALHTLGRHRQMVTLPVYGGQPYERQFRALRRGVQVVVATPGRLIDHLDRGTLNLETIRTVVLDEADEMLNMGFVEDIERILAAVTGEHQTALFSATLPARVRTLANKYLVDPLKISVATRDAVAPRVRQVYYEVNWRSKADALARILDFEEPRSAIVFVRTRRDADDVTEQLNAAGYIAQAIHGDINQAQRERVLERFRAGHTQLLVGTDVAARGLDIPDVSHVINYDLPLDPESYVHRIGRTGRAGQAGEALTLVTPRERRQLATIEHAIHRRLAPLRLPTDEQIAERRRAGFRDELLKILDGGELDSFLTLVEDLSSSRDIAEIAAAALKMASHREQPRNPTPSSQTTADAGTGRAASAGRGGPAESRAGRDRSGGEWTRSGGAETRAPRAPRPEEAGGSGSRSAESRPAPAARPARANRTAHTTRLFLRIGRRHGLRPADLVGAIANECNLPGDQIGDIDLYDTFSFVDVPTSEAVMVEEVLNRIQIRGRAVHATIAVPPTPGTVQPERPVRPAQRTSAAPRPPASDASRTSSTGDSVRKPREAPRERHRTRD